MRLPRRTWQAVAAVLPLLLGACTERRPTAQELEEWEQFSNRTVVFSAVWQGVALAALAFFVWLVVRLRQGEAPPWPKSVVVLLGVMTGILQLPTIAFFGLWTA